MPIYSPDKHELSFLTQFSHIKDFIELWGSGNSWNF